MSLESNPNGAPASKYEQIPTHNKTANELEIGDYLVEYGARLVRKFGRGGQQVLILDDNPNLERLVDAYEEFQVS